MIHYTTCEEGNNVRQESRENESDSSAGKKCETICCWLPAVLSLFSTLPSFILFLLQSIKVLSQLVSAQPVYTLETSHTSAHTTKHASKDNRQV